MVYSPIDSHREPNSNRDLWRRWLAPSAVILVLALLLYMPLLRSFPEQRISSTYPDALEFIWSTWRLQGVLAGTKPVYFAHEVFAPAGASLLLHTICESVLIPITATLSGFDPIWRYNIALIVVSILSGWAALALFKSFGCGPLAATLASLLVVYSPWNIAHLHSGHLNFVALFAFLEALRGMATRSGLRYALAVTLLCFTNLYYLYFAALLLPAFVLKAMLETTTVSARPLHNRALAASRVLLPFIIGLIPAALHLTQVAILARSGTYSPDHNPTKHAADITSLFVPSSVQRLGAYEIATSLRSAVTLHAGESSLYLGFAIIFAAILACCVGAQKTTQSARFFISLALLFAILSFGPVISWQGVALASNPLDYVARSLLPLYPSVPARLAGMTSILLIAAAAQLITRSQTTRIRSMGYALFIISFLEFLPIPLGVYPLPLPSSTLAYLASDADATVVADLSASPQYALLRQTVHGKPIIGGFLSRHPLQGANLVNRNRFIRQMRGQASVDAEAAIKDWCRLSANRLLLELPTAQVRREQLADLGFKQIHSDPFLALYAPGADLCSHAASMGSSDFNLNSAVKED